MISPKIKCVVWDLDNTLWNGILLEDENVSIKETAVKCIKELDARGILQSISSKNDYKTAKKKLVEFNIWDYFIYPQINWDSKSNSVAEIARSINIGKDTLAFIDDQQFELDEVNFNYPEVFCINASKIDEVLEMDRMMPEYITSDSKNRREMYQNDIKRNRIEDEFSGTKEEFLHTLGMVLKISYAKEEDLQRAEELTVRTHQLNSTGYTYSYNELKKFIESDQYVVLVARLEDKYGEYGTIGLALIEKKKTFWNLQLLLMSCRVISKGVGNVMMNYIINMAIRAERELRAQFVPTDCNRIMYIAYKFNGFKEIKKTKELVTFAADMSYKRDIPDYITVVFEGE